MIKKRSIRISGHDTSVTMEEEFWSSLRQIAQREGLSLNKIIAQIDQDNKDSSNLSSATRVFILNDFIKQKDDVRH